MNVLSAMKGGGNADVYRYDRRGKKKRTRREEEEEEAAERRAEKEREREREKEKEKEKQQEQEQEEAKRKRTAPRDGGGGADVATLERLGGATPSSWPSVRPSTAPASAPPAAASAERSVRSMPIHEGRAAAMREAERVRAQSAWPAAPPHPLSQQSLGAFPWSPVPTRCTLMGMPTKGSVFIVASGADHSSGGADALAPPLSVVEAHPTITFWYYGAVPDTLYASAPNARMYPCANSALVLAQVIADIAWRMEHAPLTPLAVYVDDATSTSATNAPFSVLDSFVSFLRARVSMTATPLELTRWLNMAQMH
uniref:Uncharacterized protein n=1 Tax=Sexangularia sp. CB-2014 TaxID=1486929 RepID=A0A7S1YCK5_9EUKA